MAARNGVRTLALLVHIVTSVGWLGAVVAYLAVAITGLRTTDTATGRAAYLALDAIAGWSIAPLSLLALAGGIVSALTSRWRLVHHWWVVTKLGLTFLSTLVLWKHLPAIGDMAAIAREPSWSAATAEPLRVQLVVHAAGGLVVLLVVAAISVYKPFGRTPLGVEAQGATAPARARAAEIAAALPRAAATIPRRARHRTGTRWGLIVGVHGVGLALAALVMHLVGGGMRPH